MPARIKGHYTCAGNSSVVSKFIAGLIVLLLSACHSLQKNPNEIRDESLAASSEQILIADQAFITDSAFYIRFKRGDRIIHGGGNWSNRIDLPTHPSDPSTAYILPLEYEQNTPWPTTESEGHKIRILGVTSWRNFRNRLLTNLFPANPRQGIVIHFPEDDYFLYRNDQAVFNSMLLQNKPPEYTVGDTFPASQLVARAFPILKKFLKDEGINETRITFNTGDTGPYSLPFLYVNTELKLPVFARLEPHPSGYATSSRLMAMARTSYHVLKSHTTGIASHPATSVYRLFFVSTDTLAEALRPDWLISLEGKAPPPLTHEEGMDLAVWEADLDRLLDRQATRGNIDYLIDGESFFTRFSDAVTSAGKEIKLRMYIFDDDDYAVKIADMLKHQSNRGINVKVLLDGLGTVVSSLETQSSLPRTHRPPFSMKRYLEADSRVKVRATDNPWMTGDHVKTVTIDGITAFLGGMNIAREYRFDWHDMMVELHGPIVNDVETEFDKAWAHASFLGELAYPFIRTPPYRGDSRDTYPIRLLHTSLHNAEIFHTQRRAIQRARSYIYVENPYFTDDSMLRDLIEARHRGVDVRVIVPLVTDRGPITRNNILAANVMMEHDIRVFIYPGMSHVKAAVFDGWACLGSANWDRWSLQINKELNIATSDPEAVATLIMELFERDFARSTEITDAYSVNWQDQLIEKFGDYFF